MEKSQVLEIIGREKLVPVIRTNSRKDARNAVEILSKCGIKVFEITMTSERGDLIAELTEENKRNSDRRGNGLDKDQAGKMHRSRSAIYRESAFDAEKKHQILPRKTRSPSCPAA